MPKAVILINTEMGADEEIFETLKNLPEVRAVYMVYGLYDIVAIIESDDMGKLRDIVYKNLRSSPRVRSTLTMIVVKDHENF
ncbi:Transcriptional regulator, AsnC family [Pyrodictium delaneyi]|uniref:AsnC family transcriptional regulator n=1 Tax=Pyrodictium delaneyi TaxID=1273541 RepID=A0A0P0N1X8_9CREN|nr:Lrp/AsnC ligand binding domain-containing protein [Pyrodictium delaneyi]ALL00600.1 Transcriptional regulator, AsnC family [Pyrodictium delaneyi]OWJ54060.1 AsnC family transcriptional regulator [Pyrodictium delaneyi]